MSFKDYFSSKAWFDGVQGHLMNIALTDLDARWAKLYVVKEVVLFNIDTLVGGIIYCISNFFSTVGNLCTTATGWIWNHTLGGILNSPDNHNTDKSIDETQTQDSIKTPPISDNNMAPDESTVPNTEVSDLSEHSSEMSGQDSTAE